VHYLHQTVGVAEHSLAWNAESIGMGISMMIIAGLLSIEPRIATIAFEFGFFFLTGGLVLMRRRVIYVLIVAVDVRKRTIARIAIVTHVV